MSSKTSPGFFICSDTVQKLLLVLSYVVASTQKMAEYGVAFSYDSTLMLFGFCLDRPSPVRQQCVVRILQITLYLSFVICLLGQQTDELGGLGRHSIRVFALQLLSETS